MILINITLLGISVISAPTLLTILSKQYYYIDDLGHKNDVEMTYDCTYVLGVFIVSFIVPFTIVGVLNTTQDFKDMVSNQSNAKIMRYSEHGYVYVFNTIRKDFMGDIVSGIGATVGDFSFQYFLSYSIQMNISKTIDWKYMGMAFLLKFIGTTGTTFVLTKFKPTFMFDKDSKQYLFAMVFVITTSIICSDILFEKAFILSIDDASSKKCSSNNFTIDSNILVAVTLLLERAITFLVFNLYSIPSEISWSYFNELSTKSQESQEKFLNEVQKTKVLQSSICLYFLSLLSS